MARFTVQTLNRRQLNDASAQLANTSVTFSPEVIIGIRSGGYVVAQAMADYFPYSKLLPITRRRASTEKKQKSSLVKNLLRTLPEAINSRLRIMEHIVLTQLFKPKQNVFIPDKEELKAIRSHLGQLEQSPSILIVDDSVDSGATLAAVVNLIRTIAGAGAIIKTAVITVTTTHPFIEPDYLLYRYVLCRFPWSLDFKN
jgi:hypoxanthine phosphoribosyltransferase